MSTKRSLSFYRSWWEKGNEKDEKTRLEFYDAILNYAFAGVVSDMSPVVKDLFDMIKPVIDMAILRGEAAQERGKRGGAPKGNQNARKDFGSKSEKPEPEEPKQEKREPKELVPVDPWADERAEVISGDGAKRFEEMVRAANKEPNPNEPETVDQRRERLKKQLLESQAQST